MASLTPELANLWLVSQRFELPLRMHRGFDRTAYEALCEAIHTCTTKWVNQRAIPKVSAYILCGLFSTAISNADGYRNIPHRKDVYESATHAAFTLGNLSQECVRVPSGEGDQPGDIDAPESVMLSNAWDRFITALEDSGEISSQRMDMLAVALRAYSSRWADARELSKRTASVLCEIEQRMTVVGRRRKGAPDKQISTAIFALWPLIQECVRVSPEESAEMQRLADQIH